MTNLPPTLYPSTFVCAGSLLFPNGVQLFEAWNNHAVHE